MIDRARFNVGQDGRDNEPRYTSTWQHFCPIERETLEILAGEACKVCGLGAALSIEREGQPYVDQAVYLKNKPVQRVVPMTTVAASVAVALGGAVAKPLEVLVPNRFTRTFLRWMKPGRGGLVPK